ncbi:hypothetical protein JT358_01645 [Micrococcales bacterium 31B]|nr:hypothetical protein [Micrococcales bacterium 31B]
MSASDLRQAKASLRRKIREVRREAYENANGVANRAAQALMLQRVLLPLLNDLLTESTSQCIAAFAPTSLEPDVSPLLETLLAERPEVTIYVPRYLNDTELDWVEYSPGDHLRASDRPGFGPAAGGQGVRTRDLPPLAAILLPALAATMGGRRLGQGGGYYDRVLQVIPRCLRIAVVHPHEVFRELPVGDHDEPIDWIATGGGLCAVTQAN